jgi:hypothetical protein
VGAPRHRSAQQSSEQSSYLAFIVGLHVATAIALLAFYWRDWFASSRACFALCVPDASKQATSASVG